MGVIDIFFKKINYFEIHVLKSNFFKANALIWQSSDSDKTNLHLMNFLMQFSDFELYF